MGYAILRFQKYNDVKKINNAIRHCQREFPMSTLTNPDARNIIVYTRPMLDAGYDKKSFEEVLSEKLQGNKIRKNNVLCLEYIMSFSKGTIPEDKHDDWIKTSVKWLQDFYGPTNIYKIYVHNDESNTHIHAFCIPIRDNHLCFKKFIDGPKDCKLHQDSYYEADAAEAICAGFEGKTAEEMGKYIADLCRNSPSHWSYVGSGKFSYIGIGLDYKAGTAYGWYGCVMVGRTNYG